MDASKMATSLRAEMASLQSTGKKIGGGSKGKVFRGRVQIVAFLVVIGVVVGVAQHVAKKGLPDIDPVKVHDAIAKAGVLGIVVYVVGFGLAELLHLPGLVFIVAGVLCWGKFNGWVLALLLAPTSCAISFLVVRRIGGQYLADLQWGVVRKAMEKLDEHPVRTVAVLRLCFFLAPILNYALALSNVRFKDFMIGTTVGLVPTLSIAVFFIDHLITYMGWSKAQHLEVAAAASPPPAGMWSFFG